MTVTTRRPLRVQDLMTTRVISARPDDTLALVSDLMDEHRVRHVPIVDEEEALVGLVSHRDLLRTMAHADVPSYAERTVLEQRLAKEAMSVSPESVDADTPLADAARIMLENKYGSLPVVSGMRLIGIVTESDFVRLVADDG